ncbi:histidine kinase [Rhodomicrobium udaipurense JA643]|uniref:histidine kinase n=1 Tax=Rhodomicrobium udaipurense TaxID=1202716 RepID=A0A8I1KME5_9HYPH|nr:sensor histidine kinase KdpD [Rhodomicrobium udaipurense]KAI93370.1 histidine kinase [Rhodomicrobium udaipurense JA643]MBJ7545203.1 sensor histidine kinase KdpD [Rhodomicrobium udaipurense]
MADARETNRPSPDALLELARNENRGRLKIFLGAAPGVGKTYEMLLSARAKRSEGADVVVGVVETHGRPETAALLAGYEIVPRRPVSYKGRIIEEMDLDAVLARRPQVALVDELAHTNAPGSRHPKRYMDVEELLAAGIDVYTTLNIQHVDSLNDVVAQITRIRVQETVPDFVLDKADDIEVIDLAPDELIQRLREGKVYVPEQAKRALQHYFSPGNLTALRELALRRTAQRVDEQLLTHMKAHAIEGPWAAGDRVLVCISEDPRSAGLVRYTKRLADRLRAPWTALYIETLRSQDLSIAERDRIADTLRLAERLGGLAATLPGRGRVADDVMDFARSNNVTQIVIGKSERSRWFEALYGSVVHDLVRRSANISVHVIAGDALNKETIPRKTVRTVSTSRDTDPLGYVAAIVTTAGAVIAAHVAQPYVGGETIPLMFLMGVLSIAYYFGLGASLFAAFAAMLSYNFFFIPPLYTFTIADPINISALFFFLFTALAVSNLTARVRRQAELARNRAAITSALYAFSKNLASNVTLDDLLWAAVSQIATSLKADVVILLPETGGQLSVAAAFPPGDMIADSDVGAAKWSLDNGLAAGRGADTLPGARRLFLPLRTGRGVIGVVGLGPGLRSDILLTPDERRLLDALMDQTAVAIERVKLAKEMDDARVAAEAERLRGALLTSLSHDLRTPLASILGAANSLREYDALFDAQAKSDLVLTIEEEAQRMSRFVANLLDMMRLESGAVKLRREPVDVTEILGAAVRRTAPLLKHCAVEFDIERDLPLLNLDPVLMEQVLVNLLDNAGKYAPPGSTITLRARKEGSSVRICVMDEGPGIPEDKLSLVFEKFHRADNGDRRRAGTGLGLAICRGFVEAMGGAISAANRSDRTGAILAISFPASSTVRLPHERSVT